MLRLALVGCGAHSEGAHAASLAHYAARHPGEIALAAACDPDIERAARFCREYGFAHAFPDAEEMLDREQLDGVVAVLPIEKIAEIGGLLLRRGIPCTLEKPPGRSVEEAKALAALARRTGTPHVVSLNRRFSPYFQRAVAWAAEIGAVRCIRARMLRHARREEDFLWGTGVHVVDAVCAIGGEIAESEVRRLDPAAGSAPWFLITLRFASGCAGLIEIFPTAGMVDEGFELLGEGFRAQARTMSSIIMGGREESVRCWRHGALEVELAADLRDPLFLRNGSFEETSAFIRALRDGAPLRPSLEDVLPALRICQRIPALPGEDRLP